MKESVMSTGEIFKKYRETTGLQQKELAEKLKTTRSFLSKIERNESPPSKVTLEEFFKVFKVTIEEKECILFYESFRKADSVVKNAFLEYKKKYEIVSGKLKQNDLGLKILTAVKKEELDFLNENNNQI